MLQILGTIIFGAIVGVLARAVLPGRQAYGWIVTILLGIAGALIGYWVLGRAGRQRHPGHRLDPAGHQRCRARLCSASSTPG